MSSIINLSIYVKIKIGETEEEMACGGLQLCCVIFAAVTVSVSTHSNRRHFVLLVAQLAEH